jgi:hypothetical protein
MQWPWLNKRFFEPSGLKGSGFRVQGLTQPLGAETTSLIEKGYTALTTKGKIIKKLLKDSAITLNREPLTSEPLQK